MPNFLLVLSGLNVYLSGIGIFLSLALALFLFWRNIRKTALSEEKLIDILFASAVSGLVLGRIGYILFHYEVFAPSLLRGFLLFTYPGVQEIAFWLGFFLTWGLASMKQKLSFDQMVRLLAVPLLLARTLIGFFSFVRTFSLAHVYETLALLVLLGAYYLLRRQTKQGKVSETALRNFLFGALALPAFIIDFWSGDRVYFASQNILSQEQLLHLLVMVAALVSFSIKVVFKKRS